MADIELVIKIPEKEYKHIEWKANTVTNVEWWEYAINNGTPLNEVLDKIRAEIIQERDLINKGINISADDFKTGMSYALQIIDKYREVSK